MSQYNTINGITPKDAETKDERMLLGVLAQESERIGYGKVVVEFTIRAGKLDHMAITETGRRVNIGMRDQ